ncbi:hypothetical protein ABEB36_007986 [Hypothenemus hampei]|uniref:ShKT domain-containing protein n=1 Tax=Hypothenemus hampei TaxID=57062 RepID=A0ABD1EKE7_HYPHA
MFGCRSIVILVPAVMVLLLHLTEEFSNFNLTRRPKLMGEKLPFAAITPKRQRVQDKIIMYHNFFRSIVEPKAGNMLKMKWHNEAANAAQRWADQCRYLKHDDSSGRYIPNYGSCGQNIFIANNRVPWLFAIETWWLERNAFKYGEINFNKSIIGHYTQMVWAATHQLGCGLSECHLMIKRKKEIDEKKQVFYNYVCNYCPIGNRPSRTTRPYKLGNPCSHCKKDCSQRLCLNSCDVVDQWINCKQLYKVHPAWLCRTHTQKGKERAQFCKATCTCSNKIYD